MRLELTERLRCPVPHAPTPLIVVASETRDRDLVRGVAGCPVCRLEVPIREGHVRFDLAAAERDAPAAMPPVIPRDAPPDVERTIALLGLDTPEGAVPLTGIYASIAGPLAAATGVVAVVLSATPADAVAGASATAPVSAVTGALAALPFTDGTFRGAALDAALPMALVADAPRTVAVRGRLLAAVAVPPPAGLRELARDDREWVAAREAVPTVVGLTRRT